ncbi:MAG: H-NS histone family protein [Variovorax sp.]
MTTYKELLQQREALERDIAAARHNEVQEAVARVRTLIADHGLTQEDVFGRSTGRRGLPAQKVAAKYRDPATGATWSGRGKPPRWLAGKDRAAFVLG